MGRAETGPILLLFALTRNRPRVSYLSRHSFGIRPERAIAERFGFRNRSAKGKLCRTGSRRQLGSETGQGTGRESDSRHAPIQPSFPASVRAWAGLDRQPGPFPETNFCSGARRKAAGACALSGGELAAEGEQRMSVATSLALFWAGPGGAGGSSLTMLLPLLLIPVLYLVMIRPQQKRQKQWQEMLGSASRPATA